MVLSACTIAAPPCERSLQANRWSEAIRLCSATAVFDPSAAIRGGRAALQLGRLVEVEWFATLAATSEAAGDAAWLRGSVALANEQPRLAVGYLSLASAVHGIYQDRRGLARDAYQLAGARTRLGELGQALDAARLAAELAGRPDGDPRMRVFADIALAEVSRSLGDLNEAELAVEHAAAAATPADQVAVAIKQAIVYGDLDHVGLAVTPLYRALATELLSSSPRPYLLQALWLNLAIVDRRTGDPQGSLAKIEASRRYDIDEPSYRYARGRTYSLAGQLDLARRELALADDARPPGDLKYLVAIERAWVAARTGDDETAIAADQRAIDYVIEVSADAGDLAPLTVANLRQPYLHLIGIYARQHRFLDALEVIAALDAHALLVSRASPSQTPLDAVPSGAPASPRRIPAVDLDAIREAWRGRTLVIAVTDGEQMWRLVLRDGQVDGRALGPAKPLEDQARTLEAEPTNEAAGRALGQALLGDLPADPLIAVLLVGPIARTPLIALRMPPGAEVLRGRLARALGILPLDRPRLATTNARAVVLGDPDGDLPASAAEATQVARALDGALYLRQAARRDALLTARGSAVLHVAAHSHQRGVHSMLQLADGDVGRGDIAALTPSPRLVVLSSCASARGGDDAGHGSLALAFVDAGAELVVATQHSVPDGAAAKLIAAFYAAGGARDPIGALATAQIAIAASETHAASPTWSAFEVIVGRPSRVNEPRSARSSSP